MIELERHIEILLLGNDCVIVPGLGGFVAHHVNARFDSNDGMFLPPLRTLGFNQKLQMNDSVLAQSYVEAYDISYPTALQRIENDVKSLKKQLEEEGFYEIGGIGTLRTNAESNIEFTPCEAGILTPDFYGLSGFDILPKSNTTPQIENTEKTERGIIYIDSSSDKKHKTINIRLSALRNVAVAAAIVIFSFLITSPTGHTRTGITVERAESCILRDVFVNNDKATDLPVVNNKNTKPTVKAIISTPTNKENVTKEVAAEKKAKPELSDVKEDSPYWSIVLCSQVQVANAKFFSSQLEKEGLENTVIESGNGNAKVVYGKFANETEAYAKLNSMQDNARFKQAWITKINNKK